MNLSVPVRSNSVYFMLSPLDNQSGTAQTRRYAALYLLRSGAILSIPSDGQQFFFDAVPDHLLNALHLGTALGGDAHLKQDELSQWVAALMGSRGIQHAAGDLYAYDPDEYDVLRHTLVYTDYTDLDVALEADQKTMAVFSAEEAQPAVRLTYPTGQSVTLRRYALPPALTCSPVEAMGYLLFAGFGLLENGEFHGLPCLRKVVPSVGARHGLEAFVVASDSDATISGLWHYDPTEHALIHIDSQPILERADEFSIVVSVILERYMWRYRHAWAYRDVFFDFGHVLANLKIAAERIGRELTLRLMPHEPNCAAIAGEAIAVISVAKREFSS